MDCQKLLIPSGLNSSFCKDGTSFESYIDLMTRVIVESRLDLNGDNADEIVLANSPFSWKPNTDQFENGVLLIHGLFDSPYYVRDLGKYFYDKNFLVNALLLPGHGTVPGDLLDINFQEWLKAVQFGVQSLAKRVKNIYLAGYSLGGVLALYGLLQDHANIKGLVLIAPALKPRSALRSSLAKYYPLYRWMSPKTKWYKIAESSNYTKYSCYALNAGYQATQLIGKVHQKLKDQPLTIPLFVVMSKDDETISDGAILSFFNRQSHPDSRLLIYASDNYEHNDARIELRKSSYPELKILNFSHTCLMISPENPLLGRDSQYADFTHYPNGHAIKPTNLYSGAVTKENLKKYTISRLSYNPDFHYMLQKLDEFLLRSS